MPCGETLRSVPMAQLLGVNWGTLRKWCNEIDGFSQSGAFEFGARGAQYTFEPRATILWLLRHFEAERDAAAGKARRISEVLGAEQSATDGLSLAEVDKALSISIRVRDRQMQDRELAPVPRLRSLLSQTFSEIQKAGGRVIQELDPAGSWTPEERAIAEDVGRTILLKQQNAAQGLLRGLNGGSAQP